MNYSFNCKVVLFLNLLYIFTGCFGNNQDITYNTPATTITSAFYEYQNTKLIGTEYSDYIGGLEIDGNNIYVSGETDGVLSSASVNGGSSAFVLKMDYEGNIEWIKQFGSDQNDSSSGITASDTAIYICGNTEGIIDGSSSFGELDCFVAKITKTGSVEYIKQFGSNGIDRTTEIVFDQNNDIVICGITNSSFTSEKFGKFDGFICRYNELSDNFSYKMFGTPSEENVSKMFADEKSNLYLTGYTEGNLEGKLNHGFGDIFLFKYDSSFQMQWNVLVGSEKLDVGYSTGIDNEGNVYVTGYSEGMISNKANSGGKDVVVGCFDKNGSQKWIDMFGSSYNDSGNDISIGENNIYVSGYIEGKVFDNNYYGNGDAFFTAYSFDGKKKYFKTIGTEFIDGGMKICFFDQTAVIGGLTGGNLNSKNYGMIDIFISIYQKK